MSDVEIEVVDRQPTPSGFVVQQVFAATGRDCRRVRVPMCLVLRLHEGRVVGIDEYFDPAAVGSLLDEAAA